MKLSFFVIFRLWAPVVGFRRRGGAGAGANVKNEWVVVLRKLSFCVLIRLWAPLVGLAVRAGAGAGANAKHMAAEYIVIPAL